MELFFNFFIILVFVNVVTCIIEFYINRLWWKKDLKYKLIFVNISLIMAYVFILSFDKSFENRYCSRKRFVMENSDICPEQYDEIQNEIKKKKSLDE